MNFQSLRFPRFEMPLQQDDELVQRIVARLKIRLGSQLREFQLSARENGLILWGKVKIPYGKQLTQKVVREVSGQSILANNIEVDCWETV